MKIQVKIDDTTYEVEIQDLNKRPVRAKIGNDVFEVWPETSSGEAPAVQAASQTPPRHVEAARQPATGLQTSQPTNGKAILSPLPGTVIEVMVKAGAQVQTGDPLMVIEAMKMKNTIRSGRAGTIATVHVSSGQTVQHRQALVEFSE
jgi:biotin carboxyl carrier protein